MRRATHKQTGKVYACKSYNRLKLSNPNDVTNLDSEIEIMEKIDHPSIVGYCTKFENTCHVHVIMELAGNKNLKDYLRSRKNNWPSIPGRPQVIRNQDHIQEDSRGRRLPAQQQYSSS